MTESDSYNVFLRQQDRTIPLQGLSNLRSWVVQHAGMAQINDMQLLRKQLKLEILVT